MSVAAPIGFFGYVKAAFFRKVRLPLLGSLPLNVLGVAAFGVLSLAHPGFLLLGLALETLYLSSLAGSARFQAMVQGERLLNQKVRREQRDKTQLESLQSWSRTRFLDLQAKARKLEASAQGAGAFSANSASSASVLSSDSLDQVRSRGVALLLDTFLQLLGSRETIRDILEDSDLAALRKEEAGLKGEVEAAATGSALRKSLEGSLALTRRRCENLSRAQESLQIIEAEIRRIERQIDLLVEESAVGGNAESLSAQMDGVLASLETTSRWLAEHRDYLGDAESNGAEIGATELPGSGSEQRLSPPLQQPMAAPAQPASSSAPTFLEKPTAEGP